MENGPFPTIYKLSKNSEQPVSWVLLWVNFSSGSYFSGNKKDLGSLLPFDAGFEAVGIIAAVGDSVKNLKVGYPAALMTFGSYAEFTMVPSKHILPVPRPDAEVVAMLTSGLTASIALEKAAQMDSGKVVLVTAAVGGLDSLQSSMGEGLLLVHQFYWSAHAVYDNTSDDAPHPSRQNPCSDPQHDFVLAKLAGNKVVATCGGKEKAMLLKDLGVDRVIDYRAEDIKTGVDIVYESVGGEMFDLCLNALAVHGRMVVIGMISQYQGEHGWKPLNYTGLCEKLLAKSQTVAGFFLVQYSHLWQPHLDKLFHLYSLGKLKVVVCIDPTFSQQVAKL
ncbi:Prostaglandin reductase-3 [Camellia lanceoleosa]|uniref:Prostaglandin reductase-3 n=1 Tax=Camellia lanceoleosa TaxID=1840588 RepID=A0ACC0IJT3_9ERIC|nr:Prostaglandin reductase-3 [Camellia lanceoleosa]